MLTPSRRSYRHASRATASQRGVVLILAIIVLVMMSLAAVALMRSVLTGNKVAGNLAFQQSATQSADVGIESAIAWLEQNNSGTKLFQNITIGGGQPIGYFANRQDPDQTTRQTWESFWTASLVPSGRVNTLPVDAAGNTVSFVIQRLCNAVGDPNSGIGCETAPTSDSNAGGSKCAGNCGQPTGIPTQRYYRITARVIGPRNTVGFVQAVVAL